MTEYVEVARAESERGEIVLRRRIEERTADALELRVNGVFVMDTQETTSETELAAAALELVESPRGSWSAGSGSGSPPAGAGRSPGRAGRRWSRSRAR